MKNEEHDLQVACVRWFDTQYPSHIGLDTTIEFLKANDLSKTEAILLMHLSDGNSNEKQFVDIIRKQTGIPTYALDKNSKYTL